MDPPSYDQLKTDGAYPPPQGAYPPPQGAYPPPQGAYPPPQGAYPPPQGAYPPPQGAYPPPEGAYPPTQGAYPPPPGPYPSSQGAYPPAPGYFPQTTQPGTIVVEQVARPKPPDNFIPALLTCIFCNGFCIGLVALAFAYQSKEAAQVNNMELARTKGELAKKFIIVAVIVTPILIAINVAVQVMKLSIAY